MQKASVEAILAALNGASVRYLVTGGLAVAAHGYLRTTVDVDLMLDLDTANVQRALAALSKLGYRPRAPVPMEQFADADMRRRWIAEKGLTVFSLHSDIHPATEVDLFVDNPIDFQKAHLAAHRIHMADSIDVPFVSYDDLIAMKRRAGRPQDLLDIESLKLIKDADGE